jgi:hypothetical protein
MLKTLFAVSALLVAAALVVPTVSQAQAPFAAPLFAA